MSNERLEIVASTFRVRANMKQFGYMLGVSKSGGARPSSNKFIADFAKFMNNSKHPKFDGYFIGNDAMSGWIKEIRKIASTESLRIKEAAERGHPSGAFQVPSYVKECYELMEDFTAYELEMKKNPPSRYNTPPAEVVEQIGLEACQPVKTAGAALPEEDGHGTQEEAIEQVKQKRASAKRRLQDEGMGDDKVALRAANKTATRPRMERQQPSSVHDGLLNSIGQFLQQDVHNSHVQSMKTFQKAKLLKLN